MHYTRLGNYELSQLMLGTAQFGYEYGINNRSGQPSFDEVCAILQAAYEGGVNCLDTAPAYGDSEEVLGRALQETRLTGKMVVVSKALRTVREEACADEIAIDVEKAVTESLKRLQLDVLPICLVHNETNFSHVEALYRLKEKGLIHHIGASVLQPEGAREVIHSEQAEALLLATNILDRRYSHRGILRDAKTSGIAVFARSVYQQGLILMEPTDVPSDLQAVLPALNELHEVATSESISIEELALRYVLGLEGVSCVVIGVERTQQLRENLEIFAHGPISTSLQKHLSTLPLNLPSVIFEPWRWQKRVADIPAKA